MNDENLEIQLRALPEPELPVAWQGEILLAAKKSAKTNEKRSSIWPPLLFYIRAICRQNPVTVGGLAALWIIILVLKASTPVDPSDKLLLAHSDPRQPLEWTSVQDEMLLAQFLEDEPQAKPIP